MYSWTETQTKDKNITADKDFNTEYASKLSILNQGMDRENIPVDSVTPAMHNPYAYHRAYVINNVALEAAYVASYNPAGELGGGLTYNLYDNDWVMDSTHPISATLEEGFLHVEFHCWAWHYITLAAATNNSPWFSFRIYMNGVPIAESDKVFINMANIHLTADLAVPAGTADIRIAWKYSSPYPSDSKTQRMFTFNGGQLFAMNTYR